MPGNADWGTVSETAELHRLARELRNTGAELWAESRRWTVVRARLQIGHAAAVCETYSQRAALAAMNPESWWREEARLRATEELAAADLYLRRAVQAGELWNAHRLRPVPARLFEGAVQR